MNKVEMVSVYGDKVIVDLDDKVLEHFDNAKKRAFYTVAVVTGDKSFQYTTVELPTVITDIDEKINSHINKVIAAYSYAVKYDSVNNDADGSLWAKYVEYVKANPEQFFFKNGNWRVNIPRAELLAIK